MVVYLTAEGAEIAENYAIFDPLRVLCGENQCDRRTSVYLTAENAEFAENRCIVPVARCAIVKHSRRLRLNA
jgi:hypothetical protein